MKAKVMKWLKKIVVSMSVVCLGCALLVVTAFLGLMILEWVKPDEIKFDT